LVVNPEVKYLSMRGSQVALTTDMLAAKFRNLQYLDLSGSNVSGPLLSAFAALTWKRLEKLNVSNANALCAGLDDNNECIGGISHLSGLHVLDVSAVGISASETLEPLKALTGLEELYLNDNGLTSLPDGLFDGLTKLTKLRVRGNRIDVPLPDAIYERVNGFDSDVPKGETPASLTPSAAPSKAPTGRPTGPSATPSTSPPTAAPTDAPTVETSSPTPSGAARTGLDTVGVCGLLMAAAVLLSQ
jgi:hypothetical protein